MDFDRLRAFVWTVEEGTISAAAARLHRTQPAVSRLLRTLEDQVGAVLVDRAARPLAPTPAGRQVLTSARQILSLADGLPGASAHEGTPRGALRLGISRGLLWHLARPAFLAATGTFRDLDFRVRSGWSAHLHHAFCRREIDAAVLLLPLERAPVLDAQVTLIRTEPLAVIAPKPAAAGRRRTDPVAEADWVLNPDGCGFRALVARELSARGLRLRVRFEIDASPQDHIALVAAGVGLGIVPRSTLRHHPLARQVREVRVGRGTLALGVWLLAHDGVMGLGGFHQQLIRVFGGRPARATPARLSPPRRDVA